ncbi:sodium/calcium exchanger membrane region [Halovivax asiaticus JCM 14624]|uniref:Sodium/calcium exchanger membrane region n=1 Tax=Halovivax asiaticus JCM 14624 TaxID=1227490 RepID=M0BRR7_9EURY|nr:sodium:calcium antiporter [Halovivax asiaticus]ELZ13625.1 sodium/calcium exchanger membrane region [Halovivax asiaticus JCM 14624]
MFTVLGLLALAVVGTGIVWIGSRWLEDAAAKLAGAYGIPSVVHGAIIAAVGSSTPELMSVLLSATRGEFELGVGAIVGSAVFNLLVIPGIAVVIGSGIETNRDLVYKEALFYMLAVATLLLTFSLAVIYYPIDVANGRISGEVTRALALVPIVLYVLYVFTQYLDASESGTVPDEGIDLARSWGRFLVGLVLIVVGVEGLVRAAVGLGDAFGTPSFLWGMTIVAAGSSLPDAFVSITASQSGRPTVSIANVLGSNTFDLLVAIPVGILVAGSLSIRFDHVVPMMAFLVVATVIFFTISRTKMFLSRREGWLLLVLYGGFVAWLITESVGLTRVLPT